MRSASSHRSWSDSVDALVVRSYQLLFVLCDGLSKYTITYAKLIRLAKCVIPATVKSKKIYTAQRCVVTKENIYVGISKFVEV